MQIIEKLISYCFVALIYYFILSIIRMVYNDIRIISRRNAGAYLKLITIRESLNFSVKESYPIIKSLSIGRGRAATITIDDPYLSSEQCAIIVDKGDYYLEDLSSENGTRLNGDMISGDAIELVSGDNIEIGQLHFIFVTVGRI